MKRLIFVFVSGLTGTAVVGSGRVDADVSRRRGGYASFCCQAGPSPGGPGVTAVFSPCYETDDSSGGRNCLRDSFYYYPIAVRTDRNFAFNNETGELSVLAD
ncbi:MAG: hypothetical protein SGI86_12815 [Deltaproteobacteria bacterium]|nr:hypothetical protein [Deltaproteobacteria bacterium]